MLPSHRLIKLSIIATLGLAACAADTSNIDDTASQDISPAVVSEALTNNTQAFAWQSNPAPAQAVAGNANYSFNSAKSGALPTFLKLSLGTYNVDFPYILPAPGTGTAGVGNVQVVAYGTSNARCKVQDWLSDDCVSNGCKPIHAHILCHTPSGALVDSLFVVRLVQATGQGSTPSGYLTTNAAGQFFPAISYNSASSGGGNISIFHTGTGSYQARFGAIGTASDGTVQVTATGASSTYCSVGGWGQSGIGEEIIYVQCFCAGGAACDSGFSLSYDRIVPTYCDMGARAWAYDPTSSSYTPDSSYSYNSGVSTSGPLGTNTAGRISTGSYFMRHSLIPSFNRTSAFVGAYGGSSNYCKVAGWFPQGSGTEVDVRCFDAAGSPSDTLYVETFERDVCRGTN